MMGLWVTDVWEQMSRDGAVGWEQMSRDEAVGH